MNILETILSRSSIRKYTTQAVSAEIVEKLLRVAMSAPSAGNHQPWHFVVIDDRELLDAIPAVHPYSQMLKEAPLAILVCGDLQLDKQAGLWVQDCSAATENLLLAAHALKLGAVWLGVYPREKRMAGLRELLLLPENVIPFSLISIGHPAEEKSPSNRYQKARIHHNRWENR